MEWLQANWLPLVIVILAILVFIAWIIYLCKKEGLRKVALKAILIAEDRYNSTSGQERLQIAIDYVYAAIPDKVKAFIPKDLLLKFLKTFIQKLFDEIKEVLDYSKEIKKLEEGK